MAGSLDGREARAGRPRRYSVPPRQSPDPPAAAATADRQAERLRGSEVDDERERGRPLDGKLRGFRPSEHTINQRRPALVRGRTVGAIRHQTAASAIGRSSNIVGKPCLMASSGSCVRRKYALPRWVGKTMSASAPSLAITENKEGESSRLRSAIGLAPTRIAFAAVMVSSMNRCKMAWTGVPQQHPSTTTRESTGIAAKRSRRVAMSLTLKFDTP